MNISPISFTGTYKVGIGEQSTKLDKAKYFEFLDACDRLGYDNEQDTSVGKSKATGQRVYIETTTLKVPDSQDSKIEEICARMGIDFTRVNTAKEEA